MGRSEFRIPPGRAPPRLRTCPRGAPTLLVSWLFTSCSRFYFLFHDTHCTRKVIGGELQERLIPVPYSKTSTDQAVRFDTYMPEPAVSLTRLLSNFLCWPFLFFIRSTVDTVLSIYLQLCPFSILFSHWPVLLCWPFSFVPSMINEVLFYKWSHIKNKVQNI